MLFTKTPAQIEERFCPPENWHWHTLDCADYSIRYGEVVPGTGTMKGLVVCLPGLSEYCEKYFEIANELLAAGFGFLVIDWRGQGLSSRYLDNPHKRHSQGFKKDAQDLMAVLEHSALAQKAGKRFMLAHSMGGNIGFRFLDLHPDYFDGACFCAPLTGLHIFQGVPNQPASLVSGFLSSTMPTFYAPMGGDWTPIVRDQTSHLIFSQDPVREKIHNAWMLENPALQVGHITNKWLKDAHQSCLYIQKKMDVNALQLPILICLAGHESFVDNHTTEALSARLPHCQIIHLPDARHEIPMEKDVVRNVFMQKFYSLLNETGLK